MERQDYPYRQLAAQLRQQAAELAPNAPMPSITWLGQETGLSVKTVRRAIKVLAESGEVYVVPGLGTYVAERPED